MIRVGNKYQHLIHDAGCDCLSPVLERASRRLASFTRRGVLAGMGATLFGGSALAQTRPSAPEKILFRQARVFDGVSDSLRDGVQLLVEGGRISALDPANNPPPEDARVVDCGDRVLMPGLIDAHWHTLFAAVPVSTLVGGDPGSMFTASTAEAERTLLRGFTTVRDLGGPVFSFKQAIDDNVIPGPRIYPCGAMITTSGGHGDLRMLSEIPRDGGELSLSERVGGAMMVDDAGEIKRRVREQLLQGASQIKLVGSGGVSSPRSPLDMMTFSEADLKVAIDVARDWNTYATVHAYTSPPIRRAVAAGATCIEHAHLMDEETAALLAEKGVWLSIQPFLTQADSVPLTGPSLERMTQILAATPNAYELARKHGIKTAWGSDLLFSPEMTPRQPTMLTHLAHWYSNAEALRMATSVNGELLALSGPRNPYPGKLGVIEAGAFADLLVLNESPLDDIAVLADPERSLAVVMKDGRLFKSTLGA